MNLEIKDIIKVMNKKGHVVFENDSKPFNLNYIGIRNADGVGKFNDLLVMFWKYQGSWNAFFRYGTTDPGLYYLKNPLNVEGTAILKEGQYRGAWQLGLHQKKSDHPALVQRKAVTVIRDFDRDAELDLNNGKEETGFFGINHHRALKKGEAQKVGRFSAGCQVTWNPHNYDVFISICREAAEVWGNSFTYTLVNIDDF